MDTVVALVGAGFGVSVVPGSVAARPSDEVTFAPLSPAGEPITLALARPAPHGSPPAANLAALARDLTLVW